MIIKKIHKSDLAEVEELLQSYSLPTEDLNEPQVQIFEFREEDRLAGCIGVEVYAVHALLRSLVVHAHYQRRGFGKKLTNWLIRELKTKGVNEIYLLTETAEVFFRNLEFKNIERESIPESIKQSREFSELCPSTAIAMHKKI